MSFGGGGGFGGFGSNNNQTSGGFGGFGTNNANTGFGSTNTGGGFGQNANAGGSVFGGGTGNSAFGGSSGAFGSNANTGGFGSKPAFGSGNTGGGFMSPANNNASNSGFGAFGSAANNAATSSPFSGGNNSGSGMFGSTANKTGFGTASNTGNSLFGGGNTNSGSGFGSSGGFGAANNPGLGGGIGEPPGTAATPFQALSEKEPNSANQTSSFQNLLFQDPYRKWSAEELRLADYVQGRRHGNANGAGAFGVSSGFGGGFGSTNNQATSAFGGASNAAPATGGGLFGSGNMNNNNNNTATSGFGQTGASAFGGNANTSTGGLFGSNNKPSGGLFGSTPNQQSGGLFGSNSGGGSGAANNTSAFGTAANNSGSGLFGSNNQANKPQGGAFGSFGSANNNTNNASSGFGNASGSAFGAPNNTGSSGLFGAANNTQQTGGGLFGNAQQAQQNAGSAFGSAFGNQNNNQQSGGLFGNNQQKPASGGLFGAPNANSAGSVFGNANNTQQTMSAFGTGTGASTSGGLFGAAKPGTGTGLFGSANNGQAGNAGGSSVFGGLGSNTQNQQATGSSIFGAANNTQQKPGGLFGSANQTSSTSFFGGQNNQTMGASVFGNNQNQQQAQAPGFGNSLLGNSQQGGNAPQGLTANLNDVSAYGSPSLFAGLSGNEVSNPGPLATPLSGNTKPRRSSILPMYKLAPATASRFATPQKRGFGFSYSSFGTPGASPASSISSTPGALGRRLLGTSTGTLNRSMSTNNLRRSFNTEDSILAPGAFSSGSSSRWYGSTGSKKLVINREIRSDLFSTPQKDRQSLDGNSSARKLSKRVSFDTSNVPTEEGSPLRHALPAPDTTPSSQADESTPRQNRSAAPVNGSKTPDSELVKGNELAIVHEEDGNPTPEAKRTPGSDNAPGEYWMTPSKEELFSMNRMQRQRVDGFTISRINVGSIKFKIPVDLSAIELDELSGEVIQLEPRSATVYPNPAKKPPVGKGLNVPARISLEHSWPRAGRDKQAPSDPKRFKKHVERLKRIPDTTFEDYNSDTGVWTFSVEHFTTYTMDGLEEDSDDEEMTGSHERASATQVPVVDVVSDVDTAGNVSGPQFSEIVPGAFDALNNPSSGQTHALESQSFLGVSSADPASNSVLLSLDEYKNSMDDGYEMSEDEDVTRSSVGLHHAAERDDISSENDQDAKRGTPGGILRARMRAMKDSVGPVQLEVADGDDWAEMLRKTVSPMKRDRKLLKELNESSPSKSIQDLAKLDHPGVSPLKTVKTSGFAASNVMAMSQGPGFVTSIDLMNSLFDKAKPSRQSLASPPGTSFPKWPFERLDKSTSVEEAEKAFHDASRPTWGPGETLVLTRPLDVFQSHRLLGDTSDVLHLQRSGVQSQKQEIKFGKFFTESSKKFLRAQDDSTDVRLVDGVPSATLRKVKLQDLFHHEDTNDPANVHEQRVWELASILFDTIDPSTSKDTDELSRKAKLSQFWTNLVEQASAINIGLAGSSEEKAVASLAGHRVAEACKYLLDGKNFRLGTLVPLIGTCDISKDEMREQKRAWFDAKMLSEFSDAVRVIYELLSGNVCVCEGTKGVPVEDRLESFVISKKFGLDWRQSFGLRLWYANANEDGIAAAVTSFQEDLDQDREEPPLPWYDEQGIRALWKDVDAKGRQDLLWGLLRLYADDKTDLEAILRPENCQLSPLDMRLSWQLGLALVSTGKVSYGRGGAAKADASTIAYAAQLTAAGEWIGALFVLLHLGAAEMRAKAIRDHLCRHAGLIGPETGSTFTLLKEKFQIPEKWLWEAQALYMRGVKRDAPAEVKCLLRAGSLIEAHRVLVEQVAPQAIIERDYHTLSILIADFEGGQDTIADWPLGGEIYGSFLSLVLHRSKGQDAPPALLDKLLAGLRAMHDGVGDGDLIRFAAVSDMADETARELLKVAVEKQHMELRSRILNLPLTQDRLLAYSVDLSMDCYQAVLSH